MINWIIIVYVAALTVMSVVENFSDRRDDLKKAWFWFGCIPLAICGFTIFKAANHDDMADLILVQIWLDGFSGLFLFLSCMNLKEIFTQSILPTSVKLSAPTETSVKSSEED